jgi:hypothetical protein
MVSTNTGVKVLSMQYVVETRDMILCLEESIRKERKR